jgi:uncharacterized membrane protein
MQSLALLRRIPENLAGLFCYVPIGPAGVIASVVFLFVEPYRRIKSVRFHAFQSLLLAACCAGLTMALLALSVLFIGTLAPFAMLLVVVFPLLALAALLTTIVLMIKANAGEMFKLPYIGDLAERLASSS